MMVNLLVVLPKEITPELAEIAGIHAGDGYLRNDGKRAEIDISGHQRKDRSYYDNHVVPLFNKTFEIMARARDFPSRKTYGFRIYKKNLVNYFHDFFGFPFGQKTYRVKVPRIVLESKDEETYSHFLRGFFDTDGCLTFQKRYNENYSLFKRLHHIYPRIILSTTSERLASDIKEILEFLEIHYWEQIYQPKRKGWSKIFRIWIRGVSMLERWVEKIGFKNPSKVTRYMLWKRFGFCQPNTTLEERLQILKKNI